jgi:hypothetical protein
VEFDLAQRSISLYVHIHVFMMYTCI